MFWGRGKGAIYVVRGEGDAERYSYMGGKMEGIKCQGHGVKKAKRSDCQESR